MSNDSKGNGGSDLDIFEGLGKKSLGGGSTSERSAAAPPPPPGSSAHVQAAMPVDAKKTLLGINPGPMMAPPKSAPPPIPQAPQTRPSTNGMSAVGADAQGPVSQPPNSQAAMRSQSQSGPASAKPPPPPPGRGSLPNLAATKSNPPMEAAAPVSQHPSATQRVPSIAPQQQQTSSPIIPPPASTRPGAGGPATRPAGSGSPPAVQAKANGGTKLDMDWDDDQEATHVYDKDKAEAEALAAESSESLQGPEPREPERASMDAIMSSPPQRVSSQIPSAAPAAGTPPPPPPSASLSGAFGALGQPRANGSGPPSAKFKSGAPASQSMRSAPPPPPVSAKNPSLTTQPLPPPPPPGQLTTAPMHMPPQPPAPPPAQNPGSMPPQMQTLNSAQGMGSVPQMGVAAQPMGSVPPQQQQQQQHHSNHPSHHPQSHHPSAHPSAAPQPQLPPVSRAMEMTMMTRPAPSKAPVVIALLVAVMAIAGAAVFMLMPRSGSVIVNVSDAKGGAVQNLEISVDGTKRCDSAPCIVRDIPAGTHEVKVVAKGYEQPAPRVVVVESKRDVPTEFQLQASKNAAGTGFKVAATHTGVKLTVDGKDIGPLPQELRDLEPGEHKLRFGGDRYAPLEKTVSIAKDEIVDLGNISLKVVKGKATIQLGTPGAKVYLVNGTNRKEVPQFPMAIEFDPNEKWELQATKDGFDPYSEKISFDDGQAEKTFNVSLNAKGTSSSAPTPPVVVAHSNPTPAPQPAVVKTTPVAAKEPAPAKEPAAAKEPAEPAAAAGGGETILKINSLPASSIVLDGKPIGVTPQLHVVVSPGSHTVMFVNSEQSLKKTISVDVKKGETKAAFAKLRE